MKKHILCTMPMQAAFLAAACLACATALARDCATILDDSQDRFSLGDVGTSPDWKLLSTAAMKEKHCDVDVAAAYADCEYVDAQGRYLLVFGNEVTRVEIRDAWRQVGPLPFGLSPNDHVEEASTRLSVQFSGLAAGTSAPADGAGHVWTTGLCIRNSRGVLIETYVVFDKDRRLMTIGSRLDW